MLEYDNFVAVGQMVDWSKSIIDKTAKVSFSTLIQKWK